MIYYGILLFFVLEYLRPSNYVPALSHVNSGLPITVAIAAIFSKGGVSNSVVVQETASKWLFFFIGLILLSVATADVTSRAFDVLGVVIGYFLIYWAIAKTIVTKKQLKGLFSIIVLVHVGVAVTNPQLLSSDTREYLLAAPFMGDGNDFALSVNIAIPLCLYMLFDSRRVWERLLYGAGLLFLVFCVIATQSRGGTLALVCVGVYYWFKSKKKLLTGMGAVVAVAMVLVLAPPAYFQRMNDATNTEEGSAQGRIQAWNAAVRMAVDSPLLGVGAGHFGVMYGAKYRREGVGAQTAHSIYFLILGELGLPGLVMLIGYIAANLAQNRRTARMVTKRGGPGAASDVALLASVSASLIAFATCGAFLSAIYYPHMYVIAGLLVASRRVALLEAASGTTSPVAAPKKEIELHRALQPRLPRVS